MARWAYICQECWYILNGDQYFPDEPRGGYEQGCDACNDATALSVAVHPDVVAEISKIVVLWPENKEFIL